MIISVGPVVKEPGRSNVLRLPLMPGAIALVFSVGENLGSG